MLVEFAPDQQLGWDIVDFEDEISAFFGGRKVDVVNPKYVNPRLKQRVFSEAVIIYDRG